MKLILLSILLVMLVVFVVVTVILMIWPRGIGISSRNLYYYKDDRPYRNDTAPNLNPPISDSGFVGRDRK